MATEREKEREIERERERERGRVIDRGIDRRSGMVKQVGNGLEELQRSVI